MQQMDITGVRLHMFKRNMDVLKGMIIFTEPHVFHSHIEMVKSIPGAVLQLLLQQIDIAADLIFFGHNAVGIAVMMDYHRA
ncbi:hypothetical protein D3C73_833590 [compost metagenome]